MFRRGFLKAAIASIGAIFLPKRAEATDVPYLPTLEWLREHNSEIIFVSAAYESNKLGTSWQVNIVRFSNETDLYRPLVATLHFIEGQWVPYGSVVKRQTGGIDIVTEQIEWPDWLRKF